MLDTSILSDSHQLQQITEPWRDLLADSDSPAPVCTPTWMATWWSVFGPLEHRKLRVVCLHDDQGRLVGLAPLLSRFCLSPARGLGGRRLELLASGEHPQEEISSDFIGILARRGMEEPVAESLAQVLVDGGLGGWDELRITNTSGTSVLLDRLRAALITRGCLVETIPQGASPYITLPATWDDYLRIIGGRRRYFVRRTLRDLHNWAGPGAVEFHQATTLDELRHAWHLLGDLHQQRWRALGSDGAFANPRFRSFHQRIVFDRHDDRDGAVELSWLTVKDRPVAALYSLVYDNKVWFYQMGRTMDVPDGIRPGIAAHLYAIQRAIDRGRREYDFLGRERFYKLQLSTDKRPRVTFRALRRAPLPLAWEIVRRYGRAALRTARRLRILSPRAQADPTD